MHEFGHLYRAPDHYGGDDALSTDQMNAETGGQSFSKDCIFGENRNNGNVLDNYTICKGCRAIIIENIGLYDHQGGYIEGNSMGDLCDESVLLD